MRSADTIICCVSTCDYVGLRCYKGWAVCVILGRLSRFYVLKFYSHQTRWLFDSHIILNFNQPTFCLIHNYDVGVGKS